MSQEARLVSQIYIKVDGAKLQPAVIGNLIEVVVDQHTHLPSMFTIRLNDPRLELLEGGPFDLTKQVEIAADSASGENVTLIQGEITALEPIFEEGMLADLVIRGYDKSHRLYRETKSRAFLNKKDSDLAQEIARDAGLQAAVDVTSTVHEHIYQHNQTDLAFLRQRAWRIGYECFVSDGKLHFRRPPDCDAKVTLAWGDDLRWFRPRMTLAEQVDEVIVKGWDVDRQSAIVGQAQDGRLYAQVDEAQNGAGWANAGFGNGKLVIVDQPVASQAEADVLAAARLDELSGAFIVAEGLALLRPDVQAGQWLKLEHLGRRLNGNYLVTSATHIYNMEGLTTRFTVRGTRTGSLTEQMRRQRPLTRWPGVVTAVVTNSEDSKNWGRVKVKYPWMADDAESDWARVASVGAGPEAGFYAMPEVKDEVLVAFEQGDFSKPFILGGMWNGQHAVPPTVTGARRNEKPLVRSWRSRSGHAITMHDDAGKKVDITTADGHQVVMDDAEGKVEIRSAGGLTITLADNDGKIVIESSNTVEVKAGGNMILAAGANMDIKANGKVTVKGAMIELN